MVLVTCGTGDLAFGQSPSASRYYYAIENLRTGEVVRRGTTGKQGIPANGLILAPTTPYREWMLEGATGFVGLTDFTTPASGLTFSIPPISLGLPQTPDSDGDGLSDSAEFIVGTNPKLPDTNGDGVSDGAAVRLGIDAGGSLTGIVGSTDTPGTAVDVCAFNEIVVVADSERGVAVFNVFNRMAPLIVAQVDTPGNATAVACSGNLIAVADGIAGLAIIDISDPPNARITRQLNVGGTAKSVAVFGDLGFVGTQEGNLTLVELSTGVGLKTLSMGGSVEDLSLEAGRLYAYAGGKLHVLTLGDQTMTLAGSVSSPGSLQAFSGRGRLAVARGIAYAVHSSGYNTFDVSNPAAPRLLLQGTTGQNSWKQVLPNGSGQAVVAMGVNPRDDGTHNISIYRMVDPAVLGSFQTEIPTPDIARAAALYNGLAYVVDSAAGLHVMNYLAVDTRGQAPTGTLATSSQDGTVVEGSQVFLFADVRDDVQVRNVEFFVDGVRVATDGNFPYEFGWRVPGGSSGKTFQITARASDTGGNQRDLPSVSLIAGPDDQPPFVSIDSDLDAGLIFEGDVMTLRLTVRDNVGVGAHSFKLDGEPIQGIRVSSTHWQIAPQLTSGKHRLSVTVTDRGGLVGIPATKEFTVLRQAVSREVTLFNFGPVDVQGAVSRETTLYNFGPADVEGAVSREATLYNFGAADVEGAVSREVSILKQDPAPSSSGALTNKITRLP
jgi:hypothetical protein